MKKHYYRKPHRIRKKKSVFRNRFFWWGLLISTASAGLIYFLIFSSFFEIKEIKISGNQKVNRESIESLVKKEIETDFRFFKNKNINFVNLKELNKVIMKEFPQVSNVVSQKDLPEILLLDIEERKPAAIFKQDENYFFIDKEGVIFENTQKPAEGNLQFTIIQNSLLRKDLGLGETMTDKETTSRLLKLELQFRNDLKIPIKEMTMVSEERLNVMTAEGWEAYFNLQGDLDWQFTKLKTVLEKRIPPEKRGNIIYVDLRYERIYIFPESYNE